MNVLFISLLDFETINKPSIYTDLLREFVNNKHKVYAISPFSSVNSRKTYLISDENISILKLKVGSIQKTTPLKKGISTLLIDHQIKQGIIKYFNNIKFDLVLYPTPPVNLTSAVSFVKKRDGAISYLLLKDIFPQNALDLGMLKSKGISQPLYKYFRRKERLLYSISDTIGCMSVANRDYLIKHNNLNKKRVEINPNSMDINNQGTSLGDRDSIRKKYKLPINKLIFIYGGNLGKPQAVRHIVKCFERCRTIKEVFFLVVGDGTEFSTLEQYVNSHPNDNVKLIHSLPSDEYQELLAAGDVGMIFLDNRFTIPNFPSRLLSYLFANLPVLAVTDSSTDLKDVIIDGDFGWWIESDSPDRFMNIVLSIIKDETREQKGKNGYKYLKENFDVKNSYNLIVNSYKEISNIR